MTQLYMRLDTGEYITSPYEAEKQFCRYFGPMSPLKKVTPRMIRNTDDLKRVLFIAVYDNDIMVCDHETLSDKMRAEPQAVEAFDPVSTRINWPTWTSRYIWVGDFFKELSLMLVQTKVFGRHGSGDLARMKWVYVITIMMRATPHVVMNKNGGTMLLSQAGLELMRKFYA